MYCRKCLTGRTGDKVGDPCQTPGCDGIIEDVKYADLVDALPDEFLCPRRAESGNCWPGQDHWDKFKSNGNRVCSYCGSLHPDDFFTLVKQSAETSEDADYSTTVEIEPSDKGYKIYVHQPGVRNAHEGGIKYYTMHLPHGIEKWRLNVLKKQFTEACRRTRVRFERCVQQLRNERGK